MPDSQSGDTGSNPVAVIDVRVMELGIHTWLRTMVLGVRVSPRILWRIRLIGQDKRLSISKYGFDPRIRHRAVPVKILTW